MTTTSITLWETLAALERQMPVSKQAVEAILPVKLAETERTEYFVFFAAKQPVALQGDVTVTEVNLMVRPSLEFDEKSGLSLDVTGSCVGLEQVRKLYKDLELTDAPRGRSTQEVAAWTARRSWGALTFGFRQDKPDCLARVTLRRKLA